MLIVSIHIYILYKTRSSDIAINNKKIPEAARSLVAKATSAIPVVQKTALIEMVQIIHGLCQIASPTYWRLEGVLILCKITI